MVEPLVYEYVNQCYLSDSVFYFFENNRTSKKGLGFFLQIKSKLYIFLILCQNKLKIFTQEKRVCLILLLMLKVIFFYKVDNVFLVV